MNCQSKPVFILGCSRTGSKIYMNILNKYSDIHITHEMHFINPRWLHQDFIRTVRNRIGDLQDDNNVEKLLELMDQKALYGSFWKHFDYNREDLKQKLLKSSRTSKEVFEILLSIDAMRNGKSRCGAKFPLHFSYAPLLLEWFPDCKIIFITRDPRAMFVSQSMKPLSRKHIKVSKYIFRQYIDSVVAFIHINIQYLWAYRAHKKLNGMPNYYLSRYEDIVSSPKEYILRLCEFLDIEYHEDMVSTPAQDSSYAGKKEKGMDLNVVDKWRPLLSPLTAWMIKLINRSAIKEFDYH